MRLWNTGLSKPRFSNAAEAVSHLGAIQAQDYGAAKWAVGLRVAGATDQSIEDAVNRGAILRTHVLRPTWHFVAPENVRWMLELTAPGIKKRMATYNRRLELDDALFAKGNAAIGKALQADRYLTRHQLKNVLQQIGIETNVQRLAHILMRAELDAVVCSGPRHVRQNTYALFEDRVPQAKTPTREGALSKLALTYFRSHGPAQLIDFSWWSGLKMEDTRAALDSARSQLEQASVAGKTYWFRDDHKRGLRKSASCFLLSIYDEYTIAYKDRGLLSEARDVERMISMGNALTSVIIVNDKVAGAWKKRMNKSSVAIELHPFRKLNREEQQAIRLQVDRYQEFLGIPCVTF